MGSNKRKPASGPATPANRGRGEARTDAPQASGKPIKVRAIALGYYDDERKRIGDVFMIPSDRFPAGHKKAGRIKLFSEHWMEMVDPSVPLRTTTSQQALNREVHKVIREKSGTQGSDESPENANVLGN